MILPSNGIKQPLKWFKEKYLWDNLWKTSICRLWLHIYKYVKQKWQNTVLILYFVVECKGLSLFSIFLFLCILDFFFLSVISTKSRIQHLLTLVLDSPWLLKIIVDCNQCICFKNIMIFKPFEIFQMSCHIFLK